MIRSFIRWNVALIVVVMACLALPQLALAATFTINSPDDNNDGTCTNPYVNAANDCTLREAINAANGTVAADTITFSVDSSFQSNASYYSSNQYTFTVASAALSSLARPVTITGVSNWDVTSNRPGIRLFSTTTAFDALTFNSNATNSKVQGVEIQGFRNGITVSATGTTVGTDCDGTTDATERNVIHSSSNIGVNITTANVLIAGNYIGFDDDGITANKVINSSITITGASADNTVVGYRDSTSSCTVVQQRNVVAGATNGATGAAITVVGTGAINVAGDAALAPNNTVIAGNYLGVDATGSTPQGSIVGVYLFTNTTRSIIGTDGDGTNDDLEGNVIYAAGTGVAVTQTGNNRISGNSIGVTSARTQTIGSALVHGINARGTNNIIGWCDTTVDATLCSDAGVVANEGNVIGGATNDAVRLGLSCDQCSVYGNWLGVGSDGTTDLGNNNSGVFVHRSTTGNRIGGSGSKANTIRYNATGIIADGSFIGSTSLGDPTYQHAITDLVINGNTINQNDGAGVYLYWTDNYDSGTGVDITIQNNTINQNGSYGIEVVGGSPTIIGNTIQSNTSNGIALAPGLLHYDGTNEAVASGDPQYASENLLSQPSITGNTIVSNTSIGIAQLDTSASNTTTLYADNTFDTSDSTQLQAVSQAWYGAAEVLTAPGNPIPSASWSGTNVQFASSTSTTTTSTGNSAASGSDVVFGPSTINYTDVTTWQPLTDYTISAAGGTNTYNPYTISSTGTYSSQASANYTFDGVNNDTAFSGGLANGQTTDSLYRFQIAHVTASTVPATPTIISPSDGAIDISVTPTLQSSAFQDDTETHTETTWQLFSSNTACTSALISQAVINTTSTSALTSFNVPAGTLSGDTTYYWRLAYTNSFGNASDYSSCAAFTTIRTSPERISDFPAETFAEDDSLDTGIQVDDYFTDAEGETLSYSVAVENANLIVELTSTVEILLSAEADWFGDTTVTITACDSDSECVSGTMAVTVTAVNDAPTAPITGFSPADGDRSRSLRPTISWTAATDVDDASDNLSYQLRVSTNADPVEHAQMTLQTITGEPSITLITELTDETSYYYAVQTVDAAGLKSDWSATQQFVINVSNAPELSLAKTVTITAQQTALGWLVDHISIIPPALARAKAGNVTRQMSNLIAEQSLIALVGSIMLLMLTGLMVLVLARRPKHFVAALLHDVPVAFDRIHQPNLGKLTTSYISFRRRLLGARCGMYLAMLILIPAFIMNVLHAQVGSWLAKVQVASSTIEPGDSMTVTLQYRNTGDGDATSATIMDTIPSDTVFVSSAVPATQLSDQLTIDIGTIRAGDTSQVSYQLNLAEPYTRDTVVLDPAELIANEITTPVVSNSVTLAVASGSISGQVTSSSGAGLANVAISLSWGDQLTLSATTDANGHYSLSGLASADYVVRVSTQQQSATLSRGGSATINFTINTTDSVNSNTNTNANTNTTTSDTITPDDTTPDDNPVTTIDDVIDTTPITPINDIIDTIPTDVTILPTDPDLGLVPDQQVLQDSFVVLDLNNQTLPATQPIVYITDDPSQVPAGAVVLPTDTETLTFRGVTLPNSTITIQICYTILTTTSDETGAWIMVVPRNVLQQGENVVTASITHGEVTVEQIVVAHVNVNNRVVVEPNNYWINFMAIIFLLQLDVAAWLLLRARRTSTTVVVKLLFLHLVTVIIVVIFLSVPIPQSQQVEARGHLRQTDITARLVNNQGLTDQFVTLPDAPALEFIGSAEPDQQYSVSICPNQPFRYVTTNHTGQWNLILPLSVLPSHIITLAMRPETAIDEAEQQLVDIHVQDQYDVITRWRWILLVLIASGAVITICNWIIVYRKRE